MIRSRFLAVRSPVRALLKLSSSQSVSRLCRTAGREAWYLSVSTEKKKKSKYGSPDRRIADSRAIAELPSPDPL